MVAVAGACGTALRFAAGWGLQRWLGPDYPFGTLTVNVIGSGLLGAIAEGMARQTVLGVDARMVLGVGLLGGFTTYSSFNLEVYRMLEQGAWLRAAGYFVLTTAGCLLAGWIGVVLARR